MFWAHRHMRIERIGLEHHGELALGRGGVGHVLAVEQDLAGGGVLEAGDQPEQGGLSTARGADEHHELAIPDFERGIGDDGVRAEGLVDVLELNGTHLMSPPISRRRR